MWVLQYDLYWNILKTFRDNKRHQGHRNHEFQVYIRLYYDNLIFYRFPYILQQESTDVDSTDCVRPFIG